SWNMLAWGCCFVDVKRDGNPDIVVTNGHVSANVDEDGNPDNTFRQRPQLFLNLGQGHFREVSPLAGGYFQERHVGRGVAACDCDNGGHVDRDFSNSGERAVLLHNESTTPHHWLRLDLQGTKSNRDAVGARVAVSAGGRKLVRHRKGGGSYCSASDPRLFFGLAEAARAAPVEGRWPSGLGPRVGPPRRRPGLPRGRGGGGSPGGPFLTGYPGIAGGGAMSGRVRYALYAVLVILFPAAFAAGLWFFWTGRETAAAGRAAAGGDWS